LDQKTYLYKLWGSTDTGTGNDATVLCYRTRLNNGNVELVVGLVQSVETVHQIHREHAKMLVEEVDVSVVDALGDLLSDLVGRSALDHVEARPSVLSFGA
jgi:hypothetical protein